MRQDGGDGGDGGQIFHFNCCQDAESEAEPVAEGNATEILPQVGRVRSELLQGRRINTHIGLERRPRLPFLPMTGVPKCSGLVRGSLSSVCGGCKQQRLNARRQS